jgi:hypothetical protein
VDADDLLAQIACYLFLRFAQLTGFVPAAETGTEFA